MNFKNFVILRALESSWLKAPQLHLPIIRAFCQRAKGVEIEDGSARSKKFLIRPNIEEGRVTVLRKTEDE
jgi:hypothetical protein